MQGYCIVSPYPAFWFPFSFKVQYAVILILKVDRARRETLKKKERHERRRFADLFQEVMRGIINYKSSCQTPLVFSVDYQEYPRALDPNEPRDIPDLLKKDAMRDISQLPSRGWALCGLLAIRSIFVSGRTKGRES